MTARTLDPLEYAAKLAGTEFAGLWPYMPPDSTFVVVEEGDQVIGVWALILYAHVEGMWVRPDHRKQAAVMRHLLETMFAHARGRDIPTVLTAALDPEAERIILRLGGTELPGKHFVMPVPVKR